MTRAVAERWGLSAQRQMAGGPLSMAGGLIATTALVNGLTLATRNLMDFDDLCATILNPLE